MDISKVCKDFDLDEQIIITTKGDWNGKTGIIESIQHGMWTDKQHDLREAVTEYLVRDTSDVKRTCSGRMVLHPGDFRKLTPADVDMKAMAKKLCFLADEGYFADSEIKKVKKVAEILTS